GTLNVGGLSLSSNTSFNFDVNANTSNDLLFVTGAGTVTQSGNSGITLNIQSTPATSTNFTVLQENTATDLTGMFTLNTTSFGRTTFAIDSTQLTLGKVQINVGGGAANMFW